MLLKQRILDRIKHPAAADLDDFEEQLMFGDLAGLLARWRQLPDAPEDMVRGLETLQGFRQHYQATSQSLTASAKSRVAALDAAWCMELIELARRERAGHYYRA